MALLTAVLHDNLSARYGSARGSEAQADAAPSSNRRPKGLLGASSGAAQGCGHSHPTNRLSFGQLLGSAPCMRELFADLRQIATSCASVLIEGETGTGKELVADSIHRASPRAIEPFVVFDCGAVPPSLIESELFGHERGAFTGATAARRGLFEEAHGGTIFLDELGELPKDLQPKLLRVLEKQEVRRLGGNRTIAVDVRVVAATNRDLRAEVARGAFREDLYYRVATTHVHIPPLRERLADLPLLVDHFLNRAGAPNSHRDIPPEVWRSMTSYQWPGNVRELQNAVQRLIIGQLPRLTNGSPLASRTPIAPQTVSATPPRPMVPLRHARKQAIACFERDYLEQVLKEADGNITRAAAVANVTRQMIQYLMRKHGI